MIVDIGANFGYFALALSEIHPKARIFAVEPVTEIFDILKENTKTFPQIKIFQLAISDKVGKSTLLYDKTMPEASYVVDKTHLLNSTSRLVTATTTTVVVFSQKNKIRQIDYLKIDVESFEKHVLLGASQMLSKTHFLCLEISAANNPHYTFSEILSLLHGRDYSF